MTVARLRSPRRLRRRLAVMCVLLAGFSSGFLAITSYFVIREYRYRTFEDQAIRKVELASALLPVSGANGSDLARSLSGYGQRGGFDALAVRDGVVGSSTPSLDEMSIPTKLRADPEAIPDGVRAEVAGQETLVIGRFGADDATRLYFFFSTEDLHSSISQFRNVLLAAWLATVLVSAVVGVWLSRRMLRPVRDAAKAAQALAGRLLGDEVPAHIDDEFELWVESYNELAHALETKISELSDAAERERRFTSDVAHELRTPLTAMASATALLESRLDQIPPDARRPIELLIIDVRRLQTLVIELLELARLDAGSQTMHLERLRLRPALLAVLQSRPGAKDIVLDVPDGLAVVADRAHFRRVMSNLVDNALAHGGPNVLVRGRRRDQAADIEVIDDGPGVRPEDEDHIFDRFYKADAGRSQQGSGLGLAIAREHARALGGSLTLQNTDDGGAHFVFSVPLATEEDHGSSRFAPSQTSRV